MVTIDLDLFGCIVTQHEEGEIEKSIALCNEVHIGRFDIVMTAQACR